MKPIKLAGPTPEKNAKSWDLREISLLGTATDSAIAKKLGRTVRAVETMRRLKDIPCFTNRGRLWTKSAIAKLGTMPDMHLAKALGVTRKCVFENREKRNIPNFRDAK